MRLAPQQPRRGPRGATLPSSLRHAALLVAVVGTVAVGAQVTRTAHADAVTSRVSAAAAVLDGRQPDGAPAFASEGLTRTLFAVTVETPAPTTAAATLVATPRATSTVPAPLAASAPVPPCTGHAMVAGAAGGLFLLGGGNREVFHGFRTLLRLSAAPALLV